VGRPSHRAVSASPCVTVVEVQMTPRTATFALCSTWGTLSFRAEAIVYPLRISSVVRRSAHHLRTRFDRSLAKFCLLSPALYRLRGTGHVHQSVLEDPATGFKRALTANTPTFPLDPLTRRARSYSGKPRHVRVCSATSAYVRSGISKPSFTRVTRSMKRPFSVFWM
jgi:hypothetical protein